MQNRILNILLNKDYSISNSCGCGFGGDKLTEQNVKDFLFYVLKNANQYGDRAVIVKNGGLKDVSAKIESGLFIVKKGLKSINEI